MRFPRENRWSEMAAQSAQRTRSTCSPLWRTMPACGRDRGGRRLCRTRSCCRYSDDEDFEALGECVRERSEKFKVPFQVVPGDLGLAEHRV